MNQFFDNIYVKGTMPEIATTLLKKWCVDFGLEETKHKYVSYSLLNDLRIRNIKTKEEFKMWAGVSGCNFQMVDRTGGCHNFLGNDKNIYETICE